MSGQPKRIQMRRTKGWRKPEGAVYVGRPSVLGNPYRVEVHGAWEWEAKFRYWMFLTDLLDGASADLCSAGLGWRPLTDEEWRVFDALVAARGRDVACWCALDKPCHGDVVLEVANSDRLARLAAAREQARSA